MKRWAKWAVGPAVVVAALVVGSASRAEAQWGFSFGNGGVSVYSGYGNPGFGYAGNPYAYNNYAYGYNQFGGFPQSYGAFRPTPNFGYGGYGGHHHHHHHCW